MNSARPNSPAFAVTVYIVLNILARWAALMSRTTNHANDATIIEKILSGQYSQPLRVVAFNTLEGWARMSPKTLRAQSDVTVVREMDLKHEIEKDIERYSSILESTSLVS